MGRWVKGVIVGLFVALVGNLLGLSSIGTAFEQKVGLPWLFFVRGPIPAPSNVVVVAIEDGTGERLGLPQLPRDWPRSIHAELIDKLVAAGAAVIVFDVYFGREKSAADDARLVDAVKRAKRVVLVELLTGKQQPISDQSGRHVGMVWTEKTLPPFADLATAAAGLGTFPLPKQDAAVDQFWVFKESADNAPTLPAVALQLYARGATSALMGRLPDPPSGQAKTLPGIDAAFDTPAKLVGLMRQLRRSFEGAADLRAATMESPSSDQALDPLDALQGLYTGNAHRFLNFYGPPGTIVRVPYQAVILGGDPNLPKDALDFEGKVVFVGHSDLYNPGQLDRFYTVFTSEDGVDLAGVEIAATGFANLLTNRSLTPIGGGRAILLLTLFGLGIGLLVYLMPAIWGVPLTIGLAVLYAFASQLLFDDQTLLVPVATPLLVQTPLALFIGLLGQYLWERERGQRISDAINYYLPDEIARDLSRNKLVEGKINKVVFSTCLATDMAGFSTVSEQLPPGELADYLNDYFETLASPLKAHGVHVTEFRADAIMCAWTADEESPEPRERALLAALQAGEAINTFKERRKLDDVQLRIGLEAGRVYVGHSGGGGRFVYSIVGDTANTASRIEGLNKHIGTRILATAQVVDGLDSFLVRPVGCYQFVNKTEAVPVCEVLGLKQHASVGQIDLCKQFALAMSLFDQAEWARAIKAFEHVLENFPGDGPARFLLGRCQTYIEHPDRVGQAGVVRMDVK